MLKKHELSLKSLQENHQNSVPKSPLHHTSLTSLIKSFVNEKIWRKEGDSFLGDSDGAFCGNSYRLLTKSL